MQNPFSHRHYEKASTRGAVVHEQEHGGHHSGADEESTVSQCFISPHHQTNKKSWTSLFSRLENKTFQVVKVTQIAVIEVVTPQHLDNTYTCTATNSIGSSFSTTRLKQRHRGSTAPCQPGSFPLSPNVTSFKLIWWFKQILERRK